MKFLKTALTIIVIMLIILVGSKHELGLARQSFGKNIPPHIPTYVEGEIIVKYKTGITNLNTTQNILNDNSLEHKENLGELVLLKILDKQKVKEKIAQLESNPNIEYAEPNYLYYPMSINTNDTHRSWLWGLHNTGQTINGGTVNADWVCSAKMVDNIMKIVYMPRGI